MVDKMIVTFPGGKKTNVSFRNQSVKSDLPVEDGGEDTQPMPYEIYFAALGACSSTVVLEFSERRGIDVSDVFVEVSIDYNKESKLVENVDLVVNVPDTYPEKYRKALVAAMNVCHVKRQIESPPQVEAYLKVKGE